MILWFIINIYLISISFLVWSSENPSNLLSEDRESYVNGVIFGKPLSNLRMGVSFQGNHLVIRKLELSVPTAAAKSCLTLCNHRAPLSMGFFRQEYWRGLPFPSPGDPPDPGIEARSPAWRVDSLPLRHLGSSVSLAFLSTFPAPHSRGWSINACGIKPDALYMFYFC